MHALFWFVAYCLIFLPIGLSIFSIFLMMTQKAVEPDLYVDDGSWGQDIDEMAKRRYKSNS